MPRIRQNAETYARKDFQRAIGIAQVEAELTQKKMLAEVSGIPYATLWRRLNNPDDFTLGEIRQLLRVIPVTPVALLRFLGFSRKETVALPDQNNERNYYD